MTKAWLLSAVLAGACGDDGGEAVDVTSASSYAGRHAYRTAVALDSSGRVHAVYADEDGAVIYAVREPGGWVRSRVSDADAGYAGLALDGADRPRIVYLAADGSVRYVHQGD